MSRTGEGLREALNIIPQLRDEFWSNLRINGTGEHLNQSLEHAGRLADFFDLAQLMCLDALTREESCGGHFREEHKTEEGEALRDDLDFAHVSVWDFQGPVESPALHEEPLTFRALPLAQRNYKI